MSAIVRENSLEAHIFTHQPHELDPHWLEVGIVRDTPELRMYRMNSRPAFTPSTPILDLPCGKYPEGDTPTGSRCSTPANSPLVASPYRATGQGSLTPLYLSPSKSFLSASGNKSCFTEGSSCTTLPSLYTEDNDDEGPRRSQSLDNIIDMLSKAERAFSLELEPELSLEGTAGTYFVSNESGQRIGVFKPSDEEVCGKHNPRGLTDCSAVLKTSIPSGEGWKREIAAYRMDHGHFAGVPETFEVRIPNCYFPKEVAKGCTKGRKIGSFQRFVDSDAESWDVLPGRLPLADVHHIAILDIRLCNSDRHGGNVLVQRGQDGTINHLVPIDHGCCIPMHLEDLDFEWFLWPQAKVPFDDASLRYIECLNPDDDARILLEELNIDELSVENVRASTKLLKEAARAGLTAYDIAGLMRRPLLDEPSELELAIQKSRMGSGSLLDYRKLDELISCMVSSHVSCLPQQKKATGDANSTACTNV